MIALDQETSAAVARVKAEAKFAAAAAAAGADPSKDTKKVSNPSNNPGTAKDLELSLILTRVQFLIVRQIFLKKIISQEMCFKRILFSVAQVPCNLHMRKFLALEILETRIFPR